MPVGGSRIAGWGLWIGAKMGCQHQYVLQAGERRVGHSNVGPGRCRGQGALEKTGGNAKNHWLQLETLKPGGEGPTAPMPKAVRHGQRGGVDGDEKGLHA